MITKDTVLPDPSELVVEECELSYPYLKAGAFHLGKQCEAENNEYLLCKKEEQDPRKCINEGKLVTKCAMNFFRMVKKNCADEFTDHAICLDRSMAEMAYRRCRKTQAIYDTCMYEKLDIKRPPYGYFSEVRVHHSIRPKPPIEPPPVYPDALVDGPPGDKDLPRNGPSNYSSRMFGFM